MSFAEESVLLQKHKIKVVETRIEKILDDITQEEKKVNSLYSRIYNGNV